MPNTTPEMECPEGPAVQLTCQQLLQKTHDMAFATKINTDTIMKRLDAGDKRFVALDDRITALEDGVGPFLRIRKVFVRVFWLMLVAVSYPMGQWLWETIHRAPKPPSPTGP